MQVTLRSLSLLSGVCRSATDDLGFFRDPLSTDGSDVATSVLLRTCWHLHLEREPAEEIIFYCFCKYICGSSPQNKGMSVRSWGEAVLGVCGGGSGGGVLLSHSYLPHGKLSIHTCLGGKLSILRGRRTADTHRAGAQGCKARQSCALLH